MVFSQDGIFNRAEQATDKYGQSKARETLELLLGEAQMRKYESGLTDAELDEEIAKVGSLLPKENENSNNQQVIVEGHIFEIDRSVPKIVDYKGPANGVIITAQVSQSGNWQNPVATVTGTITKYGGGSVTSSSATATNGVTITGFPTTGGNYTISNITTDTEITITATDSDGKTEIKTIEVKLKDAMPVAEAKRLVTSMEALQEYVGTKVDYKDGETWQVFYYDQAGDFGPTNTLYLKKEHYEESETELTLSTKTAETDPAVQMMRRMNPLWAGSSAHNAVDLDNEKACVWLCDPSVWDSQKNDTYSSFAIGSPSVEMYMKAFNVYKTGNKDATNLIYKLDDTSRKYGYLVGANNDYTWNDSDEYWTGNGSIEPGPGNVFMTEDYWWWLASPSSVDDYIVLFVNGSDANVDTGDCSDMTGVCPVVPLDL